MIRTILFLPVIFIFIISNCIAYPKQDETKYLQNLEKRLKLLEIRDSNYKQESKNNKLNLSKNDSITLLLKKRIWELEQQLVEVKEPLQPIPVEYLPIWITLMVFILTIFLGISTYQSFVKVREANEKIIEAEKKLNKINSIVQKADTQIYESKKQISSFNTNSINTIREFNKDSKEKINEIDRLSKTALEQINNQGQDFLDSINKIKVIERSLMSNESYIKISVECLFDLFTYLACTLEKPDFKTILARKQGVSEIHSLLETDRFNGFAKLSQVGRKYDLDYLYERINHESDQRLKKLAIKAIGLIERRETSEL